MLCLNCKNPYDEDDVGDAPIRYWCPICLKRFNEDNVFRAEVMRSAAAAVSPRCVENGAVGFQLAELARLLKERTW